MVADDGKAIFLEALAEPGGKSIGVAVGVGERYRSD